MKICCKPLLFTLKTTIYLILSTFKCWKTSLITLYSSAAIAFCVGLLAYYHFQDSVITIVNIVDPEFAATMVSFDTPVFYASCLIFILAHFNSTT